MKNLILILTLLGVSLIAVANESAFENVTDSSGITDEEKKKADSYIHQGIAAKKTSEMCEEGQGGYKDICTEEQKGFKSDSKLSKLEVLVPAMTKAYSMFNAVGAMSGSGGGGLTKSSLTDKGEQIYQVNGKTEIDGKAVTKDTPNASEKTENSQDYCQYIGMVGEAVNTGYMALKNDKTKQVYNTSKPEAKQAASFYAIADSHKSMKKAASVQFGTWSATGACYVAYAAQAAYSGDWKVYAKMGAAVVIATYYKKKADAHKERMDLLKKMAKDLPQAGECNPFTNKSCFCAEETSYTYDPTNFANICIPKPLVKAGTNPNEGFVCADENGKADINCKCAETNTCIDKKLKVAGMKLGLNPLQLKDPLSAIKPVSKGLITGDFNQAANKNLALAKKALKKYKPKTFPKLSKGQKAIAKDFLKNGIPKAAAIMMGKGSKSGTSTAPSSATAGLSGGILKGIQGNNHAFANKKPRIKSGGNLAKRRSSKKGNPFGRFGKKRKKNGGAIEIEDFARKAEREAEIVKDSSKGIFDIISYRYKVSAWRQFKENLQPTSER